MRKITEAAFQVYHAAANVNTESALEQELAEGMHQYYYAAPTPVSYAPPTPMPAPPMSAYAVPRRRCMNMQMQYGYTMQHVPLTQQFLRRTPLSYKHSIAYVLNPVTTDSMQTPTQSPRLQQHSMEPTLKSEGAPTPAKKKRKARICKTEGCEKYVVDRGLCIRHGGGKRCSVDGCNCRAQNRGLCWKHGGYTRCTVEGCTKRAKSRGICWSHGGGTRCKHDGCIKIAVSQGLCWAHGGGKRCRIDGCRKPAYERNGNLCAEHCSSSIKMEATR